MKIHEIIAEIAETKRKNNYGEFKNLMESLEFDELLGLLKFARELEKYCARNIGTRV